MRTYPEQRHDLVDWLRSVEKRLGAAALHCYETCTRHEHFKDPRNRETAEQRQQILKDDAQAKARQ